MLPVRWCDLRSVCLNSFQFCLISCLFLWLPVHLTYFLPVLSDFLSVLSDFLSVWLNSCMFNLTPRPFFGLPASSGGQKWSTTRWTRTSFASSSWTISSKSGRIWGLICKSRRVCVCVCLCVSVGFCVCGSVSVYLCVSTHTVDNLTDYTDKDKGPRLDLQQEVMWLRSGENGNPRTPCHPNLSLIYQTYRYTDAWYLTQHVSACTI